jgi:hypothetical protein
MSYKIRVGGMTFIEKKKPKKKSKTCGGSSKHTKHTKSAKPTKSKGQCTKKK